MSFKSRLKWCNLELVTVAAHAATSARDWEKSAETAAAEVAELMKRSAAAEV